VAGENDDLLNPDEIESLLNANAGGAPPPPEPPATEDTAEPAESPDSEQSSDLVNASEIEALLNAGAASPTPAASAPPSPPAPEPSSTLVDASEIEALLMQRDTDAGPPEPTASNAEDLITQAENNLAAALAPNPGETRGIPAGLGTPEQYEFQSFDSILATSEQNVELKAIEDVELDLRIELGRTELLIEEVLKLRDGSVVPLDKLAGDPVDILVNGRLVARGEVLVLNDNFCVRVAEILTPGF